MSRWLVPGVVGIVLGACWTSSSPPPPPQPFQPVAHPTVPPPKLLSGTPTTLTPDIVLAKIRAAYMGGVKRCYSVLLKNHGGARGRVMITFTVDPNGSAQRAEVHGFADPVDACIAAQIATWRFPLPKNGTGVATEASFALPLDLAPD